jgi:hypothetical protein
MHLLLKTHSTIIAAFVPSAFNKFETHQLRLAADLAMVF